MADKVELTAESGKDDVAAYVEEVVNEVAAERAGETGTGAGKPGKSDAQIVAEQATAKRPSPSKPAGKTTTAEKLEKYIQANTSIT